MGSRQVRDALAFSGLLSRGLLAWTGCMPERYPVGSHFTAIGPVLAKTVRAERALQPWLMLFHFRPVFSLRRVDWRSG